MSLIKSLSIYFLSTIIERGIAFIIVPLLTIKILPENMGKLALITSIYAFVCPFVMLGTGSAISIELYKKEQKEKFSHYFTASLLINLLSFLFFFILSIFLSSFLAKTIGCSKVWVMVIPFFCFFESIKSTALSLFQIKKKAIYFAILSLSYSIINFSSSFIFIYYFAFDFEGRLSGMFVAGVFVLIAAMIFFYKMDLLNFKIYKKHITDILKYGSSLLPHSLGYLVLDMSDRFFINKFVNKTELGIYSISYLLASVIYILTNATFSSSWTPYLYDKLAKNDHEADLQIVRTSYLYFFAVLIICILYCIAIPFIYEIFIDKTYHSGINYCFIIILGNFFMSIYLIFTGIIFYSKKNTIFAYISIVNITVNLTLNYFFIKHWGTWGAAIATCLSLFIFMALTAYNSNKIKKLPWREGFSNFFALK